MLKTCSEADFEHTVAAAVEAEIQQAVERMQEMNRYVIKLNGVSVQKKSQETKAKGQERYQACKGAKKFLQNGCPKQMVNLASRWCHAAREGDGEQIKKSLWEAKWDLHEVQVG